MTVLLDTSVLLAFFHKGDPRHAAARSLLHRVLRGEHGTPLASLDVLDEGLTTLQRRRAGVEACRAFASLVFPDGAGRPAVRLVAADVDQTRRALALFFERYDRQLSMTDCILATLARDHGAAVASFDHGFDGIVERISA
jgi:predicted nucleic acid-binding protein